MIHGIVFDLWNSLAHDRERPNPLRLLAERLGIAGTPGWARRLERGMMMAPATGIEAGLRQLEAREGLVLPDAAARTEVVERWRADDAALYSDVLPALDRLRPRFQLGLCSNSQSFGLEFLDRERLWERLDASAFSFEVGALKPRPEMFHTVCRRLNLAPETVLMVGDHGHNDIEGARAAGLRAVRLARGAGELSHAEDAGVDAIPGLVAIPDLVESINRGA